ncbi:glycosyltransferase family 4 protein [Photobacterium sp. CCB-ST2H9]|uniref:glycosyltransferase family 4 protein n=1 Tax=Photobacterium sp. CCB-ST2H9 TaxID=2912855 RepID=UPI002006B05F|nr:glycosyltransferase family 4 protein [Photobacterium sp. CCB-ST2H9]UTM56552.1 glycosyltransferase family 4 protein [Photobacterium sp. CCB-ST2H9]
MKVVVISANTSWYLYNFRKNTILSLIRDGYEVIAVAPRDSYTQKLESLGCKYHHIRIDQGGTNPILDFMTLIYFIVIYNRLKVDLVLNFTPKNNIYSTLAAKVNNAKVVNNIAGLGTIFTKNTISSKIAKLLYKFSQKYADLIFFQNEDDRRIFSEMKVAEKVITDRLPGSGVDLNRFQIKEAPNDGRVKFLLIARMLYEKGISQYVEAARILKEKYSNLDFRLLGFLDVDNPSAVSQNQMNEWSAEGVVDYLGVSDSVEKEIADVDCMVLPSYYREGVPKSLLESAAMGKPIVTTDNVGCRETVNDNVNGFLCVPKSSESLATALEKIIKMSYQERLQMGAESRKKVENEFDEKIVISKYLHIVNQLLI